MDMKYINILFRKWIKRFHAFEDVTGTLSHLVYCTEAWFGAAIKDLPQLQLAQNKAARLILLSSGCEGKYRGNACDLVSLA